MNLVNQLKNLGLSDKEAKVYIAILQTGKASAYAIAKHSGIKKPTAYVVLDDLIKKGAVIKRPEAKVVQYIAVGPEEFFAKVKSKMITAEKEALPELKALSRGKNYKVKVSYFEGIDGLKEMYNALLKKAGDKGYPAFYAHGQDTSPELLNLFKEMSEKFFKKKISRRGITVFHPTLFKYFNPKYLKKNNITLKTLPQKKYNSNVSIEIVRNCTFITSHKHLQGVVIDNPDVARVMRQIFNLVWERDDVFVKY